ncbi:uncharacterized protein LOC110816164 isoform X3 [Carica papaya]|uniref:uncharacterized protein LOC110816164 isoform X3 n=1 Tax=Carica papaya TaxID=3649 RepID=UPI000B8D1973|nr:uncharacterized protein LOC110816164 isoform X3 [Carica papaya]
MCLMLTNCLMKDATFCAVIPGFPSMSWASLSRRGHLFPYLKQLRCTTYQSSYAAVPLYRRFCQATGYGGTIQRKESVEEKIARHAKDGTITKRCGLSSYKCFLC